MNLPKTILLSGALLPLAVISAGAQEVQKAEPRSDKVGLLVGIPADAGSSNEKNSSPVSRYETWWVIRDSTGAHVAAKLHDVIVPRKEGFWRLGIQPTCQFRPPDKDYPDDRGEIVTEEIEYAVPIQETPELWLDYPACDAATQDRVFAPGYDPYATSSDNDVPKECRWKKKSFTSVLPDLVSIDAAMGVRETCDPHEREEYRAYVQNPDDTQSHLSFGSIFGENGNREWSRAINAELDEAGVTPEEGGWYLAHSGGQWHAVAQLQWGGYTVENVHSANTKVSVPRSLTHSAPLPIPWGQLEKQLPGLADVYVSPGGSVLLTVQTKEDPSTHQLHISCVSLFDFTGGKLGLKLLDLPATHIVMAEWSTGDYVDKWTHVLSAVEKQGLPKPSLQHRVPGP